MNVLASAIQERFETLVKEYDRRLQEHPDYAAMPASLRCEVARRTLDFVTGWLESGNDTQLVRFIQAQAKERVAQGLDIEMMQHAVNELEAIIEPLVTDVKTAKLVWYTLPKAREIITQQAAKTLRASEAKLRQLIDHLSLGFYRTTLEGRLLEANTAFLKITGYASLDAVNQIGVPSLYADPSDRQQLLQMLQQGPVTGFETNFRRADGQIVGVSISVRLSQEEEATGCLEGTLEDITERKHAQEQVIRREAILKAVSIAAEYFLETASWEENIDLVLQQLGQATGVSRVSAYENRTGKGGSLLTKLRYEWVAAGIPPQINNPQLQEFSWERGGFGRWIEVMSQGQILYGLVSEFPDAERTLLAARGIRSLVVVPVFVGSTWWGYISFDDYRTARQWSAAEVNALKIAADALGAAIRRKQAEEESRAARQQLFDIIDFLPDATFVIDQDKKVIAWNRAIEEMAGVRKADILGQGDYAYAIPFYGQRRPIIIDLIGVEDPEFESKYEYVQRQGNSLYAEVFVPSMFGGRGAEVWVTASPLLDSHGNQVGAIESIRDVTERKRLERQIQQSLERRGHQVQVSTQVAQEIAAAPALDELFHRVVTLIKERFGYYHAQLFRYEPSQDAVVLVTGFGEAGQKMLAAGHKLAMGHGVVGTAAATGKSILATDVTQDQDWRPSPNLPDTKGELAVPIKLRDQVLGILDVQSDRAGALTAEDQLLLEGLCGQIAAAMESTRLLGELRTNEAQLSEALHIAKLAYWEYDVEKDLFLFNDQFYSLFHTTAEREGGYQVSSARYAQKFVHPDDLAVVGAEIERALASTDRHYNRQLDHRILYADGGVGHISVNINIDRDEQGRILRYYGANQDITENKRAEQALMEEQRRTQTILETVTVPMIISRLSDSKVLYANQALADFRHMDLNELIGSRTVDYFVNPEDRNKLVEILQRQGYANDFETQLRGSEGVVSWVLLSARIINFQDETCVLSSYVDITERKQAEVKMQETLQELERLYRATAREGWQAFRETEQTVAGYLFDRAELRPAEDVWLPEVEQAIQHNTLVPPADEHNVAVAPLSVRGEVIGAVGVYDDPQRPLSQEELGLMQEIAEQGALALESARLFEQTRAALEEVEATHRRYLREQWETYLGEATEKAFGFVAGPGGVKAADEAWLPEMEQALEIGEPVIVSTSGDPAQRAALAVPIKLRGSPIGALEFYDEGAPRTWGDDERALVQALADQAALALENARLFEETQTRAQREQLINTITARIRASMDMEAILHTTAEELAKTLNLSRARIRLGTGNGDPPADQPDNVPFRR